MGARQFSGYDVLSRTDLLGALRLRGVLPAFDRVVADHVTYRFGTGGRAPRGREVAVTGHVVTRGVHALVVTVGGRTHRPDGGPFHLTLALAPGRAAVTANAAVARGRVVPLAPFVVATRAF
jgi:hypothetical protein